MKCVADGGSLKIVCQLNESFTVSPLVKKENKLNHLCLTVFIPTGRMRKGFGGGVLGEGDIHETDPESKILSQGSQTEEEIPFLSLLGQVKQNSLTEHIGHFLGNGNEVLCSIYSLVM